MRLTTMTFNLVNAAIRRETLHGKTFVVAPMAMLTEGVHNGSNGPLLYREADCKQAVPAWNMKPVVVYHPQINGQGVSACDPDILERQQVGMILNTRWQGKLRAEAWIDEERAQAVDSRVLEALENNQMMEVSTGLFTDNVEEEGEWGGTPYTAIATNHQPDHLALLPDKIGACSIADGAGLLQLNETAQTKGLDLTRLFAREMDVMRRMVGNAMSHSNTHSAISRALHDRLNTQDVWVVDVYDGFFIYDLEQDKKLYRLGYKETNDVVEITGDPMEVVRVTEYRTIAGEFVGNEAQGIQGKESKMDKKVLVDGLIANAGTQWGEEDREALMLLEESALTKMAPVESTGDAGAAPPKAEGGEGDGEGDGEAPVANEVQPTMEQYVAGAPPEYRDVLLNGLAAHNEQKAALIERITANTLNLFSKEFLATKGLSELKGLAAIAAPVVNDATPPTQPVAMYNGQATLDGMPVVANAEGAETPLEVPSMDFALASD